ncbi:MAG TPA: hypothetical protein ENN72_05375 [Firmicutes bacterium]|nr:hypothetical protein [Bacillota bacterium]
MKKIGRGQPRQTQGGTPRLPIKTEPYYCHESSWRETARFFDVILWPLPRDPWAADEAVEKIYFLEKVLKKKVYPSFDQILLWENIAYQYHKLQSAGLPLIDAFISYDYDEVTQFLKSCSYPLLFKKDWSTPPQSTENIFSYKEGKRRTEQAFRLGIPGKHRGYRSKQGVFFMKGLQRGAWRDVVYVMDAGVIHQKNTERPLCDKGKALLAEVSKLEGLRDYRAVFHFYPKSGDYFLEFISPFLTDFSLFSPAPENDSHFIPGKKTLESVLLREVIRRILEENVSASDAGARDILLKK